MKRIPVSGPSITEREIAYVTEAVQTAWFSNANAFNVKFEAAFAKKMGARHALALPSCTSAIHLSLAALGVGPGDEVIVADVTWIASAAPITYVGAKPVFADIDPETWCLSSTSVEACLTPRTKAILSVDLYGGMPDYTALRAIAKKNGIALIEDAAEAVGSRFGDRMAGALGDVGVFSFHGSKTITTGEGGMLITDRDDIARRVAVLRDHGRAPGDTQFFNHEVGFKYKMSALQAALGLAQLERLDELVEKKRTLFRAYRERLAGIPGLRMNAEPPGTTNSYWMATVVLDASFGIPKQKLMAELDARGIDTRPFFHPLSSLPAFREQEQARAARERNRNSYAISPFGINLPSGATITESDVDRVTEALRASLGTPSRRFTSRAPEAVA